MAATHPGGAGRRQWLVLAAAGLLGACEPLKPAPRGVLDVTGADWGRGFRLQDPDGVWRTLADYRGKVVMVFFGFTQCPDICPAALAKAVETLALLGERRQQVQVVFISLDPERDTPPILRAYAASFDADMVALRGDLELTERTAQAYKVFYRKVPQGGTYTLDHSALVYLHDSTGQLRRALQPSLPVAEQALQVQDLLAAT